MRGCWRWLLLLAKLLQLFEDLLRGLGVLGNAVGIVGGRGARGRGRRVGVDAGEDDGLLGAGGCAGSSGRVLILTADLLLW